MCALLRKREALEVEIEPEYLGFDIPKRFVVGYGLDVGEEYRNLSVIATLTDEANKRAIRAQPPAAGTS